VSDGDVTPGIYTAAAPVFNHRGEVVGSVSLSGLRRPGSDGIDFVPLIAAAGSDLSASLGYQAPGGS
jgi:DNA-binding IclR family transcriptional regulator